MSIGISEIPNASLKDYTTFQLGGPCKALLQCETPSHLFATVSSLHRNKEKFILIGGGSNVVVSDHGVDCYVVRFVSDVPLIEPDDDDPNLLVVSASTKLDDLAKYCAENGLEGLNCTTGIPGTVGGAVVGNAGAFGQQIGDVVIVAELLQMDDAYTDPMMLIASQEDLKFSYRHSCLKETGDIVLSVTFALKSGNRDQLLQEREDILKVRREKHPDLSKEPCAGSFFRNVEPTSKAGKRQAAGWFLDQAGGRDLSHGGAKIFSKHANIIIKDNECTAQDVFELHTKMAALAKSKFDLDLIREVRFVGDFKGRPNDMNDTIW